MSYEEKAKELFGLLSHKSDTESFSIPMNGFRGQFVILHCLQDAGGEMYAGDLAKALHVTSGRIATAIKRLDAMGLVTKRKCAYDGRKTSVILTEMGREALSKHEERILTFLTRRLSRLTEEEAAEYIRLTLKMR